MSHTKATRELIDTWSQSEIGSPGVLVVIGTETSISARLLVGPRTRQNVHITENRGCRISNVRAVMKVSKRILSVFLKRKSETTYWCRCNPSSARNKANMTWPSSTKFSALNMIEPYSFWFSLDNSRDYFLKGSKLTLDRFLYNAIYVTYSLTCLFFSFQSDFHKPLTYQHISPFTTNTFKSL
jgi:hypothetical protein